MKEGLKRSVPGFTERSIANVLALVDNGSRFQCLTEFIKGPQLICEQRTEETRGAADRPSPT